MTPLHLNFRPQGLRLATEADWNFVVKVQKQHTNALGFLPGGALRAYIESGRVLVGEQNDAEAGYIVGRPKMRYDPRIAPITQCAVAMDAQRRHLGLRMVACWMLAAALDGRSCVQCWCADDIDAAQFWPAAGFTAIARRYPTNARARSLTLWRAMTSGDPLHPSFLEIPAVAGYRAAGIGRVEALNGRFDPARVQKPESLLLDYMIDDGRISCAR